MTSTRRITEMVMAPRTAWWSTMRATRWILVLTVFAATLTVRANDTPLLIELEPRTRLFPAGVSAAGFHFLGWSLVLIGSAGWTTRLLPRALSVLYLLAGIASMFVYLIPENEGLVAMLGLMISLWQGIYLLRADPGETQASDPIASRPNRA